MADFCGFLECGGDPDRIVTIVLKQWLALANAIFRPTHSRRVQQQLANQFGPESASTDPALTTRWEAAHG